MSKLVITISEEKYDLFQLCYKYTDRHITYNFSHGVKNWFNEENFINLLTALKENSNFGIYLDDLNGSTDIRTRGGITYFLMSRNVGDYRSKMDVSFSNEIVLEAYEKIFPKIMQRMVTTDKIIDPKHYFLKLANYDAKKYVELLDFSKQFIEGTLPLCTQIYGFGNDGKTTFVKLLKSLDKNSGIKCRSLMSGVNSVDFRLLQSGEYKYGIIEDLVITDLIGEMIKKLDNKGVKFIIIGNLHSTETIVEINEYLKSLNCFSVHMTSNFPSNNIHSLEWLDEAKMSEFFNFIMN